MRRFGLPVHFALRIIHVALWLTIPTVFWLWLISEETPSDCVPPFAGYEGNALCISDFAFLLIVLGMFLMGAFIGACWTGGYFVEIVFRVLHGDRKLPPVQLRVIGAGWGLIKSSLRYWLPFIVVFLAAHAIRAEVYPWDFRSPVLNMLPRIVALVVFWGYLVGLARGVASGERSLIWKRRENVRLALSNFRATMAVTVLMFVVVKLADVVWNGLNDFLFMWKDLDLVTKAALGSFLFYSVLVSYSIAYSHLVAWYAGKIGIGDHLMDSERIG